MYYQVNDACFPSAISAAQAAASSQIGALKEHGGTLYAVDVSAVTASSITYSLLPVGGGAPVVLVAPYAAQECQLLNLDDGLQLGWMVAAVWLAAFGVMFMARALRGETGDNYGNT